MTCDGEGGKEFPKAQFDWDPSHKQWIHRGTIPLHNSAGQYLNADGSLAISTEMPADETEEPM